MINLYAKSHLNSNIRSISTSHKCDIYLSCFSILCRKYNLDLSRVPTLNENDLKEQFVRGWGPGGQSVNKSNNCVVLTHLPTGFVVKCHTTRSLETNRKMARERMIEKLDIEINGENSIKEQKKRIDGKRNADAERKKNKLTALRNMWKNKQNID